MNQNFNTKTVRSAVRVALFNKDNYIYLNGSRSKVRYMLSYQNGTLYLVTADKEDVVLYFIINAIPQTTSEMDALVSETAKLIIARIFGYEEESEHYEKVA